MTVHSHIEQRSIPTWELPEPSRYPMYFDKRVYQGSSGRIYPCRIMSLADGLTNRDWTIVTLENDHVLLEIMPELGGRILRGYDKHARNDFFYRQDSIKPALVGLAGPWMSGGVEFNWPQHHRPATWMPTAHSIEHSEDGSITVWLGDHDPMHRMRGTLGLCLRPDSALIEAKVRLCNRSPITRTFLWWANVAAAVHDDYQSFFPPDVDHVADHAARAMSHFPIANNEYYGVDHRPGTDLSWYRNIPVPTSYMVRETGFDFFGGFDHGPGAGFLHVADRHIAPGKKQWTWGNHDFGHAWDRELDDQCRPYVELMAGVYTDNQPDFTYLLPYEVKTFSRILVALPGHRSCLPG